MRSRRRGCEGTSSTFHMVDSELAGPVTPPLPIGSRRFHAREDGAAPRSNRGERGAVSEPARHADLQEPSKHAPTSASGYWRRNKAGNARVSRVTVNITDRKLAVDHRARNALAVAIVRLTMASNIDGYVAAIEDRRLLCVCGLSLRALMSSIMRWRSGLMASVLMGTLLSEVDDTSILRKRPTGQHHCSFKCSLRSQKSRPPQRAIAAAI
jgi:hypothetical protein